MIHVLGEIKSGASVGGKAEQLDRLIKAGLPVPPGIVLDAETWGEADWEERLAPSLTKIPSSLYVVRSSASVEDGAETSFAGVFRSMIRLSQADLLPAIFAVRQHASQVAPTAEFSVIVQTWIEGQVSGVSFTRHPTKDYGDCLVTDALAGSAQQIVDGTGAPQRAFSWDQQRLVPETYPLTQVQLETLASHLKTIETLLGCPVDVEWTMERDQLQFLQARPMTRVPESTLVDRAEADIMRRYGSDHHLLLVRNELEETLPNPSRVSFDLLRFLFREQGAYHKAALELGMIYHPEQVDAYFVNILGHLYINPKTPPFTVPRNVFRSLETSWHLQKELKRFPLSYYTDTVYEPPTEAPIQTLLSQLEARLGYLYAKTSILARLAFTHPHTMGCPYEEIWKQRELWLAGRPASIPTQDLELSQETGWRTRTPWKQPETIRDLYAIMREDVKDDMRPWFLALRTAILNERPNDALAFDRPLISTITVDRSTEDIVWHTLRTDHAQHLIASPFVWKHLWNIRLSGQGAEVDEERPVGVSEGIIEGSCVQPASPLEPIAPGTIIILEALTPDWFPILDHSPAGIVTEKGSLMSHGAIQCRERHIPALFGFHSARQRCPQHCRIRIDGKRGELLILE